MIALTLDHPSPFSGSMVRWCEALRVLAIFLGFCAPAILLPEPLLEPKWIHQFGVHSADLMIRVLSMSDSAIDGLALAVDIPNCSRWQQYETSLQAFA